MKLDFVHSMKTKYITLSDKITTRMVISVKHCKAMKMPKGLKSVLKDQNTSHHLGLNFIWNRYYCPYTEYSR